MLTIVIDPSRTGSGDAFAQETRSFLDWLRASPAAAGFDRVRIPGDPERESRERRLAQGIPVDATTWRDIGDAAEQLGLSRADVDRLARGG
jgi:uncharacterized oxidoreductase